MTDAVPSFPNFTDAELPDRMSQADVLANRYTEATLERHKREGLDLAVRARWVALAIIAVLLPFLNPNWEVIYYEFLLLVVAMIGWFQRRIGRVGQSRSELLLLFLDLVVLTFALVYPNPLSVRGWPPETVYHFGNFIYFFVILAAGTLAYSWRTVAAIGTWSAALWVSAAGIMWWFSQPDPEFDAAARAAFGHDPDMLKLMNPNNLNFDIRIQEVVVFVIVAVTLAISIRRFNRLLLGNAALERERENLSRYFSPNVVDELSRKDEPLKQISTHDVAVLFVDIVGFTSYASARHPEEVIATLRDFHGLMEHEVFGHGGTLDKYLGDGLMATFGTPLPGERDATNALRCAIAMARAVDTWNERRDNSGDPPIAASFGLHFGPAVLGDIGANRLEFAVIGNTVNVASRIESLTRDLSVRIAASEDLCRQVVNETGDAEDALPGMSVHPGQSIRGIREKLTVRTIP